MVAGLQVENTATSSFNTSRGGQGSSTYNTSIMSETLRRYQAASYQTRVQKPQNEETFSKTVVDLTNQPANQSLKEQVIIKFMHFFKTFSEAQAFGEYVTPKYVQRANDLFGDQSRQSLTVDLKDLNQYSP